MTTYVDGSYMYIRDTVPVTFIVYGRLFFVKVCEGMVLQSK